MLKLFSKERERERERKNKELRNFGSWRGRRKLFFLLMLSVDVNIVGATYFITNSNPGAATNGQATTSRVTTSLKQEVDGEVSMSLFVFR